MKDVSRLHESQQTLSKALLPAAPPWPIGRRDTGHTVLSFLDTFSGYHKIYMHPTYSEMTTFVTPTGIRENALRIEVSREHVPTTRSPSIQQPSRNECRGLHRRHGNQDQV